MTGCRLVAHGLVTRFLPSGFAGFAPVARWDAGHFLQGFAVVPHVLSSFFLEAWASLGMLLFAVLACAESLIGTDRIEPSFAVVALPQVGEIRGAG